VRSIGLQIEGKLVARERNVNTTSILALFFWCAHKQFSTGIPLQTLSAGAGTEVTEVTTLTGMKTDRISVRICFYIYV
jgi:hypothetical protein